VRFPPHLLEEIRARIPASDLVGRRVRLKKAGREWRGLSPFNAEKTPSFYVNDQKQFYHCFSSGKHGDIFTFLMETEGLAFPEAVERLAAEAGVALPKPDARADAAEARRKDDLEVMELACAFFEGTLARSEGAKGRDYLRTRGLDGAVRERFRLGYAPNERHALRDHLASKGIEPARMAELGLLRLGEGVAVPYDYFRDRAIFPIRDLRGRVIAFGGRALSADVPAKYLNSPETPLFHKGDVLYNLDRARKAAHARGTLVAVEGYVDAIAMDRAGHANAVAPLGTALTENQLALLWRHADEPVLCFDGDKAGRRAAYRALDLALPALSAGKSLRFALLPEGQDPDDLLNAGGPAAVDRALAAAQPLVEVLWSREREAKEIVTPEDRAGLDRRLREAVATIRDETLRRFYQDEMRARLRTLSPAASGRRQGQGREGYGRERGASGGRFAPPAAPLRASAGLSGSALFAGGASPREAVIVAVLAAHPDLLAGHHADLSWEEIASLDLDHPEARALRDALLGAVADGEQPEPAIVAARLKRAGLEAAAERVAARVGPSERWMLRPDADPLRLEDALRQAIVLHRKARTLHSELREAERAFAVEETEARFAWLCEVREQISSLAGAEADADDPGTVEA
jgi:DNA primase